MVPFLSCTVKISGPDYYHLFPHAHAFVKDHRQPNLSSSSNDLNTPNVSLALEK